MPVDALDSIRSKYESKYKPRQISTYQYWARVVRVVDGDTIDFAVSLGFDLEMRARVRLLGVDTPEIYGVKAGSREHREGVVASDLVKSILPPGRWVELIVYGGRREKFGRWLGEVFVDGRNLNADLVARGYEYLG